MATPPGGGYPPSAPPAPSAPSAYAAPQAWQPPSYGSAPSSYSPASYSSAPASYSSVPTTYSSAPPPPSTYGTASPSPSTYGTPSPSLEYSNSMRAQFNSQSSFGSSHPPPSSSFLDPQHQSSSYAQAQPPNSYEKPGHHNPASYNQTPYSDPSKGPSPYQSQKVSNYGPPATPPSYGQPTPGSYGQTPSNFGGHQPTTYGKPAAQQSPYGQSAASPYGQQTYGQPPSQYSSSSYPPAGQYGSPYGMSYNSGGNPNVQFLPGADPEAIRSFELGDIDGSGLIDAAELGRVLSTGLPFSLRTVHLMLHLYSAHGTEKIGPTEFVKLWAALKDWKACFERSDRDRSGRIDSQELHDGLLSMGYSISPPLLQILISKYDRTGQAKAVDYDNFVECGLVVKGLTDRFKMKDTRFTGSATLDYDTFMHMVLPFIVA